MVTDRLSKLRLAPFIWVVALVLCVAQGAMAQRKITPVQPKAGTVGTVTNKEPEFDKSVLVERMDAQGNTILVDTITGKEWVDTTAVSHIPRMEYPLFESVSVGLNLWDPVMRILGQRYGGADVWAELSIHNRYKPWIGFGLGSADDTPDGMNFTFRSKLAPYFRIGFNYNMFYNNSPDYQLLLGVRYGFTSFNYEFTGVTVDEGYWDDPSHFNIPSQHSTVGFLEFLAGIRVLLFRPISMGWEVKYQSIMHESQARYGKPMYIPGYGSRDGNWSASFSIIYTLQLNKRQAPVVNSQNE